jgi:hypothetical protein
MKIPLITCAALAALVSLAPVWAADRDAPAAAPSRAPDAKCRVASIPAHDVQHQRTVTVPEVRCDRRVPVYETVQVPVYETHQVPVTETVQRPVYTERQVPIYRTERTPVWGEKVVPVYRNVSKPVTLTLWNPFGCEDAHIDLWDTCDQVPCGTKTVRAVVDWQENQVPCGTRTERVRTGTREEQVVTGTRCERTQVGQREERRFTGWRHESVVVEPAKTQTVTESVHEPCETVTVIPDGTMREAPLAGTSRVLTESQYRSELAEAR